VFANDDGAKVASGRMISPLRCKLNIFWCKCDIARLDTVARLSGANAILQDLTPLLVQDLTPLLVESAKLVSALLIRDLDSSQP
jgi:hypothetical protein